MSTNKKEYKMFCDSNIEFTNKMRGPPLRGVHMSAACLQCPVSPPGPVARQSEDSKKSEKLTHADNIKECLESKSKLFVACFEYFRLSL